jgi:hypothetical protein
VAATLKELGTGVLQRGGGESRPQRRSCSTSPGRCLLGARWPRRHRIGRLAAAASFRHAAMHCGNLLSTTLEGIGAGTIRVRDIPAATQMTKHTILFLAASPRGTDARALGVETRSIREELERSGYRDCFTFETRWATRPLDVLHELRRFKPAVVHFSGRGGRKGLFFEGDNGRANRVSIAALAQTFGAVGAVTKLVVLSACYSEDQAEALLAYVDCVVGVRGARYDIARAFAVGMYGGLVEGESVLAAHRQGCAAVALEGLTVRDWPRLKIREGVDAARLVLAEPGRVAASPLLEPARPSVPPVGSQRSENLAASRAAIAAPGPRAPSAGELVREIYVRLLVGLAEEAILRAAMLAEAALQHALSVPSLVEASPAVRAALGEDLFYGLGWLIRRRAEAGLVPEARLGERLEDAERAAELATRTAIRCGLLDEPAVHAARCAAVPSAAVPMPDALLRLDRREHRSRLDDLLALPRRVLVVLIYGEADQGHEHFEKVAIWRTRAAAQGPWRRRRVEWPQPSPRADMRLGFLLDSFATAVGTTFAPSAPRPDGGAGEDAWIAALEPTLSACDRSGERLFLHHAITRLDGGDPELWARYLRMVWLPLAARRGAHVVCCLELRRTERAGFPFSRAWRLARAQHRIAWEIATSLEEQVVPGDGHCAALPELSSATPHDIADWLRAERRLARSEAMAEAEQIVTLTRGGRFDLVIQRLAALRLDTLR